MLTRIKISQFEDEELNRLKNRYRPRQTTKTTKRGADAINISPKESLGFRILRIVKAAVARMSRPPVIIMPNQRVISNGVRILLEILEEPG
tara:strand:- start:35 stop:307 length:273 start_codon:yes stop_codon:yes gene_type:complete